MEPAVPPKRPREKPAPSFATISTWTQENIGAAWSMLELNIVKSDTWPYCWYPADVLLFTRGSGITLDPKKGYMRFNKQPFTDYHRFTHLAAAASPAWTGDLVMTHKEAVAKIGELDVSHRCRKNFCCNPAHLILEENQLNKDRNGCCSRVNEDPLATFPFPAIVQDPTFQAWLERNKHFVTCRHKPECLTTPASLTEATAYLARIKAVKKGPKT